MPSCQFKCKTYGMQATGEEAKVQLTSKDNLLIDVGGSGAIAVYSSAASAKVNLAGNDVKFRRKELMLLFTESIQRQVRMYRLQVIRRKSVLPAVKMVHMARSAALQFMQTSLILKLMRIK